MERPFVVGRLGNTVYVFAGGRSPRLGRGRSFDIYNCPARAHLCIHDFIRVTGVRLKDGEAKRITVKEMAANQRSKKKRRT